VLWEPYYNSKTLHSDVTQEENWFPQMQMRIKPLDWLDLRLASTKSIIYPDYRAVSPYLFKDRFPSTHVLRLGNPALKPALTQNYDIYASVYENYIGLFTVGYFYKEIDNLIVQIRYSTKDASKINNRVTLDQNQPTDIYTWTNLEKKSNVSGIELDWQTNFWYLPSYLKGLVLNINYTHTSSETFYPFYFTKRLGNPPFFTFVTVDSTRSGRLIDQPNDILNVTVGYDIGGFSARLSYLYQDDVFGSAGTTFSQLDNATEPYSRWDFTAFQELPWYDGLQLYLNLNNFTNEPDKQYTSRNLLAYAEYFGMTADFGIRYTF
jgi:TonB-dependent receptor